MGQYRRTVRASRRCPLRDRSHGSSAEGKGDAERPDWINCANLRRFAPRVQKDKQPWRSCLPGQTMCEQSSSGDVDVHRIMERKDTRKDEG